jgi:glucokinase
VSSALVVGVDVGGSGVRASRFGSDGLVGEAATAALDRSLPRDELLSRIGGVLAGVADGATAAAVAIPSFVLPDGTTAVCPSLPGLEGVDLGAALTGAAGGRPVRVVPDLAAAALGESRRGTGRGVRRFLCVALGTGANAGAVVDGAVVETAFGCLGDAGQVVVDPAGPECPCGGRGCLESIASGFAFARDGAPLGLPSARAVLEAALAGRADAVAIVERAGVALGRAIATWSALLWPERVAVAGGLAAAGELLLAPARRELARVGAPYIVGRTEVVLAELGRDATLVGAGEIALDLAATEAG